MIKRFLNCGITFLLFLIFISCQQTLVKKQEVSQQPDSSLFFKQIEINDPFFDKIDKNANQSFVLKKRLFPEIKFDSTALMFKFIEGFRVQIFAGIDSINALASKNIAKSTISDTIYTLREKGLVKLQVGDYPYYPQADSIKKRLRQTDFPGAWIVKTKILVPNTNNKNSSEDNNNKRDSEAKYKIQIIATSDEIKAKQIVNDIKTKMQLNAFYQKSDYIFKVFVGNFPTEQETREKLKIIRETKYPDAWIIYP